MRETKEIITPIQKHKIVLKTYLTGLERRQINSAYFSGIQFSVEGQNVKTDKFNPDLISKTEDKTLELLIISVNGKKEKILESLLEMHSDDYDFVVKEINEITKKKTSTK